MPSLFNLRWQGVVLILMTLGLSVFLKEAQAQEPQETVYFERIAVAPFLVGRQPLRMEEGQDEVMICTISEICVNVPSLPPEAGPVLTRIAYEQLHSRFAPHIVELDQSRAAYAQIRIDAQQDTLRTVARKSGELLDADYILIGTVWRYRDRGAIDAIAGSPASVAFAVYLVRADSGELMWQQTYEGTQRPVTSNLFEARKRLKMGLAWLSVEELARHGMGEALAQFPDWLQPLVTPRVRESSDFGVQTQEKR